MSEEILYTKYRPNKLSDVVGQDHIKQYFENAVKQDRIGHAYMLSGLRGTGKTSLARIIANIVNCKNGPSTDYDVNENISKSIINGQCPDVHELDAASNTSIDSIREIRSLARNVPIQCRKRIFICDEIHSLADKAIGALLKTLEEPPAHAMFIMATTDPQNVLATIKSRCQCFDLKRLTMQQIADRLKFICDSEKVEYDIKALEIIAKSGKGSMRDAISNLEKIIIGKKKSNIEVSDTTDFIGSCSQEFYLKFLKNVTDGDYAKTISLVKKEISTGVSPEDILLSIYENAHNMTLNKVCNDFNLFYIEDSLKGPWEKAVNKFDLLYFKIIYKTFQSGCSNLKYTPRVDFILDYAIVEVIDQIKSLK